MHWNFCAMQLLVLLLSLLLWAKTDGSTPVGRAEQQAARDALVRTSAVTGGRRLAKPINERQRVRQGSVQHFSVPGVLTRQGGAREAVLMHVYIRSRQVGSAVVFRGLMFAESIERDWYSLMDGYVCQPDVDHNDWPGLSLREVDGRREHRLRVYTELIYGHQANKPAPGTKDYNRTCMPFPFKGEVPAEEAAADYRIVIEGFRKSARFSTGLHRQPKASLPPPALQPGQPAGAPKQAAVVLYPFTPSTDKRVAADLLLLHASYHLQLGFVKIVQYTQMSFLAAFLADERLRALVKGGALELVLWDHLGECVGPPHMRCWQPLVYSHALLEAWGGDTYLLISDIDEYFVLPMEDTTLAGAIQDCTMGGKLMVKIERFDVFLSPEVEADLLEGAPEVSSLWRLDGSAAAPMEHPLLLYGIHSVGPIKQGKGFASPEHVAAYEVHNGVVFTTNPDKTLFWKDQKEAKSTMNKQCGHLVHLTNLFVSRSRPDDYPSGPDRSWQWVFHPPWGFIKPLAG